MTELEFDRIRKIDLAVGIPKFVRTAQVAARYQPEVAGIGFAEIEESFVLRQRITDRKGIILCRTNLCRLWWLSGSSCWVRAFQSDSKNFPSGRGVAFHVFQTGY